MDKKDKKHFDNHFTKCDFDDECEYCENPENGSYAIGYDSYYGEVDSYICGKCALNKLPSLIKKDEEDYRAAEEYFKNQNKQS